MFTVVIAEQAHLDSIREYQAFLKPFLDNSSIAFCDWRQEGVNLAEAVPGLYDTVSRYEKWRMIVVCDEEGLEKKNPFDLVSYKEPQWPADMDALQYYSLRREEKFRAFGEASEKPLVKLMTWLCQQPLVTAGLNDGRSYDPDYEDYLAQAREKEAIRSRIIGDYIPHIALPTEIICVAKRCYNREDYDIQTSWTVHEDIAYSRFYDWNLYFDKMRYLVFDILPKHHRNYTLDYIRFLYSLMLLAENELPMAVLSPNRVYVLDSRNDEDALKDILCRYEVKLASTQAKIHADIEKLRNRQKPRLNDRDANAIFCSNVTIPVSTVQDFDEQSLYVSKAGLGLAGDCPQSEKRRWGEGYQRVRKALARYLKLPSRSLKKATTEFHRTKCADLTDADRLNDFQLEDIATFVAEEEIKMVETRTCDLYDVERYNRTMEEQDRRVNDVLEGRMPRRWTVILGIAALVCHLIGFVPMFISNLKAENGTVFSLVFFAIGAGILAMTAILALIFLRRPVKGAISDFNGTMKGISNEVVDSLDQYSQYLTHACNVMRGNSVLNYRMEAEAPEEITIRVLQKHEMDIRKVRQELHEIFDIFLPTGDVEVDMTECYLHDFRRPVDYKYPVPFAQNRKKTIEFMQKGNMIAVPVDFVKYLRVRREDLYD